MVILLLAFFFVDIRYHTKKTKRYVVADTYYSDVWLARRQAIIAKDKPPMRRPVAKPRTKRQTGTPSIPGGVAQSSDISSLLEVTGK